MRLIFRGAHPFSNCVVLTHVGPRDSAPIIVGAAKVVDARPSICPDDCVTWAVRPCLPLGAVLIFPCLAFGRALEPVGQAWSASAFWGRSRSCGFLWRVAVEHAQSGIH